MSYKLPEIALRFEKKPGINNSVIINDLPYTFSFVNSNWENLKIRKQWYKYCIIRSIRKEL